MDLLTLWYQHLYIYEMSFYGTETSYVQIWIWLLLDTGCNLFLWKIHVYV